VSSRRGVEHSLACCNVQLAPRAGDPGIDQLTRQQAAVVAGQPNLERGDIFDTVRDAGITGFAIVAGDLYSFGYAAQPLPRTASSSPSACHS
jgi:hypothetical protein